MNAEAGDLADQLRLGGEHFAPVGQQVRSRVTTVDKRALDCQAALDALADNVGTFSDETVEISADHRIAHAYKG